MRAPTAPARSRTASGATANSICARSKRCWMRGSDSKWSGLTCSGFPQLARFNRGLARLPESFGFQVALESEMNDLLGRACAVCGKPILVDWCAVRCQRCDAAVHKSCIRAPKESDSDHCAQCGSNKNPEPRSVSRTIPERTIHTEATSGVASADDHRLDHWGNAHYVESLQVLGNTIPESN